MPSPFTTWKRNHTPTTTTAGTFAIIRRSRTRTLRRGKSMRYAPRTPEIAPDAPRLGTSRLPPVS
jgi:hypothetical protein